MMNSSFNLALLAAGVLIFAESGFPDWSHPEYQRFFLEFYQKFAEIGGEEEEINDN